MISDMDFQKTFAAVTFPTDVDPTEFDVRKDTDGQPWIANIWFIDDKS